MRVRPSIRQMINGLSIEIWKDIIDLTIHLKRGDNGVFNKLRPEDEELSCACLAAMLHFAFTGKEVCFIDYYLNQRIPKHKDKRP